MQLDVIVEMEKKYFSLPNTDTEERLYKVYI